MKPFLSLEKTDFKLIFILCFGFLLRILLINIKPPHFDEGVNGWFVDQIFETGFFKYDPTNYHGPLHFYILAIFKLIFGRSLLMLRLSSVLFGVANIYLIAKLAPIKENRLRWFVALLVALSPGMIFYSRYGIHETGFLFFTLLAVHAYLNKNFSALIFGVLGMLLMKETWIITVFAFLVAVVATRQLYKLKVSALPVIVAAFILIAFYTGLFKNMNGIFDFFKTYLPWYQTGIKGNGHEKEFLYWLKLFNRYEPFAVVGFVASLRYLFGENVKFKLISIFGLVQLLVYSLIPYKTPWCIIQLLWPFYFLSAVLFMDFFKRSKLIKFSMIFSALVLATTTTSKALSLNFINYTNESEPYVYVQTFNDIKDVMAIVLKKPPQTTTITIAMKSNWPLPWLLGDFKKISYLDKPQGLKAGSDIIFCDASWCEELKNNEFSDYYGHKFKFRASMEECMVYFSKKMFKNEVEQSILSKGIK